MAIKRSAVDEAWKLIQAVVKARHSEFEELPNIMTLKVQRKIQLWDETLHYRVNAEHEQFLFYIVPDFPVPLADLPAAAEYVARVNAGMRIGNFELDFKEGRVRFKSSIAFKGARLTRALIEAAIAPAENAFSTYMPGLIKVVIEEQSPLRAINAIDYE